MKILDVILTIMHLPGMHIGPGSKFGSDGGIVVIRMGPAWSIQFLLSQPLKTQQEIYSQAITYWLLMKTMINLQMLLH